MNPKVNIIVLCMFMNFYITKASIHDKYWKSIIFIDPVIDNYELLQVHLQRGQ